MVESFPFTTYRMTFVIVIIFFDATISPVIGFRYRGNRRFKSKLKSQLYDNYESRKALTSSEEGFLQPRIVGGKPAKFGGIPYQIAIHIDVSAKKEKFCGGSLMMHCGLPYVLTAAHCLWEGPEENDLVELKNIHIVGADLNIDNYNPREQWFKAIFQVIHPDYDARWTLNDIAIIMMDRYAFESLGLEHIELPEADWADPEYVQVSGWGSDHFGGPTLSELQFVEVPVMEWHICKKLQFVEDSFLGPKMFCMGNEDINQRRGVCKGDSGGPVAGYNYTLQRWYLAGIVSFSVNFVCGDRYSASVATRVSNYVDWIKGFVQGWLEQHGTGNPYNNQSLCKPHRNRNGAK